MKNKTILLLLILVLSLQQPGAQKPLAVGDPMPAWTLHYLLNGKGERRLNPSNGKPTMLVFWASTCNGAMSTLPTIAGLDRKYAGRLETVVIMEDVDTKKGIARIQSRPSVSGLRFPLMQRDTVLQKLFPHRGIPYVVFIGKDGLIKALASDQAINDEVIAACLAGREPALSPVQARFALHPNEERTLLDNGLLNASNRLYSATLIRDTNRLSTGFSLSYLPGDRVRIRLAGLTVKGLLYYAFQRKAGLKPFDQNKRILLQVKDPKQFGESADPLAPSPRYCYELIMSGKKETWDRTAALNEIQWDLQRFFALTASVEKRKVACLQLKIGKATDKLVKDTSNSEPYVQGLFGKYEFHNQTLADIAAELMISDVLPQFFLAEETAKDRYDLLLKMQYSSLDELKKELGAYGISLESVEREITFVVVKDR